MRSAVVAGLFAGLVAILSLPAAAKTIWHYGDMSGASLGIGASLHGAVPFPANNAWNTDISKSPVDPNSANLIASIGLKAGLHPDFGTTYRGAPSGIPYMIVAGDQKKVPVKFRYADESDPGPYPIPKDAPIEGGPNSKDDRHVLVVDRDNWKLYETFSSYPDDKGGWKAGSGAVFDLKSNKLRGVMRGGFVSSFSFPSAGITTRNAPRFTEPHARIGDVGVANVLPQNSPICAC